MIEKQELLTIGDEQYMVVATTDYNGIRYGFATHIIDDEPTEQNIILYKEGDSFKGVDDAQLVDKLITIFQKEIRNELKGLMS